MFDYTNLKPYLTREPNRSPLRLEANFQQYNPLPEGGVGDLMFGPFRRIDPTEKFSPNAWAVRKLEEDTWGQVTDLQQSIGAADGQMDSWINKVSDWFGGPKIFNNPAKAAAIKALYMNRSPMETIKYGDSQLTDEAIKEAQVTLGLLMDQEADKPFDPNNLTDNQKKIRNITDYLMYAQARKELKDNGNYSLSDYFAATTKDTAGILGKLGGPWNWYTQTVGWGMRDDDKTMPKDTTDLVEMQTRVDPYFSKDEYWERITQDPVVMEGLLDNGVSIDTIRTALNEDQANLFINRALVRSDLEQRLDSFNKNAGIIPYTTSALAGFASGMVMAPDTLPTVVGTVGYGALAKGAVSVAGAGIGFALRGTSMGASLARGTMIASEGLLTIPLGMNPTYLANMNVFARLGVTAVGAGSVMALQNAQIQNQEMAYAAALQYSDPEAQTEFDSSQVYSAFGQGMLFGAGMFLGGATISSLGGAVANRVSGVARDVEVFPGRKIRLRNEYDRRLTFENTTIGEIADSFGTIKKKFGTLLDRSPAEKVTLDAAMRDGEPTAVELNAETTSQVDRAQARAADSADAAEARPAEKLASRLDNETRRQYAERVGKAGILNTSREFFTEMGRRTTADVEANDIIGNDGSDIFRMAPSTRARVLINAEEQIKVAKAAEIKAAGGTLSPVREKFYAKLEQDRAKWLKNSLRQLTKVERQEFYKGLRGQPVADRVAIARNEAINAAERNAAADELTAQLLDTVRADEKTPQIKDFTLKALIEEIKTENKVTGTISQESADALRLTIKTGKRSKPTKINKIIQNAFKKIDPVTAASMRQIAKDHNSFLLFANGKRENVIAYFDTVNTMFESGVLTEEHRTVLLASALSFDFDSKAFDIKYVLAEKPTGLVDERAMGSYDNTTNTVTLYLDNLRNPDNEMEHAGLALLHEIGHRLVASTFTGKEHFKMLRAYNNFMSFENTTTLGLLDRKGRLDAAVVDPIKELTRQYFLSNAEEMYVESFAQLMFAVNKEALVAQLNPMQQTRLKIMMDAITQSLVNIVTGLNESTYYDTVQPLIEHMQKADSYLTNTVSNVVEDMRSIIKTLDQSTADLENEKYTARGEKSGLVFSSKDVGYIADSETTPAQLAAFAMLKSNGKELFTESGAYSKNLKTFMQYYYAQREASIYAKTIDMVSKVANISNEAYKKKISSEEIKNKLRDTLASKRSIAFGSYEQTGFLIALDDIRSGLDNDSITDTLENYMFEQMSYGNLGTDAMPVADIAEMLAKMDNDGVSKVSVSDRIRTLLLDEGLMDLAVMLDSKEIYSYRAAVTAGQEKLLNYSKKSSVVPHTVEGFKEALKGVTKNNAESMFDVIIEAVDPLVLALLGRADSPIGAINQFKVLVEEGSIVYNPDIHKWGLKQVAAPAEEPVVAKQPKKQAKPKKTLAEINAEVKKAEATSTETVELTAETVERTLTSFVDPASREAGVVNGYLHKTASKADIEDAINTVFTRFWENIEKWKARAGTDGYKTVADFRKYFIGSVKNQIRDGRKKGKSTPGLAKMKTTQAKLAAELQKAKETGAPIADLQEMYDAITFEIDTYKPSTTSSLTVTTSTGADITMPEAEGGKLGAFAPEEGKSVVKQFQDATGEWAYQIDKTLRGLLNIGEDKTAILSKEQYKLWSYLLSDKEGMDLGGKSLTDEILAAKSEEIIGRKVSAQTIQRIRSGSIKTFQDLITSLNLSIEKVRDSINPATNAIEDNSPLMRALRSHYENIASEPAAPVKEVAPEALADSAAAVASKLVDQRVIDTAPPAEPVVIPEPTPAPDETVVFAVKDVDGKPVGPALVTSEAADKLIASRDGTPTVKEAVVVKNADVVKTTGKGVVVTKTGAKAEPKVSVTVEDPKGKLAFDEKGVKITTKKVAPRKETDPVVASQKPTPKPVAKPTIVKEAEHVRLERVVNEHKDTLRANGCDTGFLANFQKAYWKVMKTFDKGGKRTSATPLFKQLFAKYISINNAIQEANINKFGQSSVDLFWKTVDNLRAEENRKATTQPGFKRTSEANLLKKAAQVVHSEYMPPVLLGTDVQIKQVDGQFTLTSKDKRVPKVVESSPFPEPAKTEAEAAKPEAPATETPAAAAETPAAAQEPPTSVNQALAALINSDVNRKSMPLRMSNFIGWIFGGSNRAERNWWQKTMSNLANVVQAQARLGDTARSDFAAIRFMTSLIDGTRNVTGMMVAPESAPPLTLLGSKGLEDRILLRLYKAQIEVMKRFGGDTKAIDSFQNYIWRKMAKSEDITVAGLVADLGMSNAQATDILPSIQALIDTNVKTNEFVLRLMDETGMGITYDAQGNPFDPKKYLNVQLDHEKLSAMRGNFDVLLNALVKARRQRKMGDLLDVNTMIALGWIDAVAEGGGDTGGLMLRNRTFKHGPGVRTLSQDTLTRLEQPGTVGGANTNTIASLARHGDPQNVFVLEHNGQIRPYRVPRTRADLAPADLLIYDQAVAGDTSMYTTRWQQALGGQELTRVEMLELLEYKMKRGKYASHANNDRPLMKIAGREEVQLAIPGLTPDEILSDASGTILGTIRTNIFEAQQFALRGRLAEMVFHNQLHKLLGRTDIRINDIFAYVSAATEADILAKAREGNWSERRIKAAQESAKRGLKRIESEYRHVVETLPHTSQDVTSDIATGALTIARMFTAPGYWLSAGPEVVGALANNHVKEWPKAVTEALRFTLGNYRTSKSGFLKSGIGDMAFALDALRPEMSNRYLGELGMGAGEIDSTFDTAWQGPRNNWNNKPMQLAERGAYLAEQVGSLQQITNFARYMYKIEMQRNIFGHLKSGRVKKLLELMRTPENRRILMDYLEASTKSASDERKYWKKFAGLAREAGFGKDPNESLLFLRYGLNTPERIDHLLWAIEKVGDSEGRVDTIKLIDLAEDVRRRPVEGIDPDVLMDAVNMYNHSLDAEILRRKTPEPYGMTRASDIESRNGLYRLVYALTGWMRAFHDGRVIDYSNKSLGGFMKFLAFYAAADMTFTMMKEWLAGRDVEDMLEEMEKNPASILARAMHSLPLFGIASGLAEDVVNKFSGGSLFQPTLELSTPGLTTVSAMMSRTDKGMSKAYDALAKGEIPEALGYGSNVLPIATMVNKSPLAVPVRVMQQAVDADEKNLVNRYLKVVQKDSKPFAKKQGTKAIQTSSGIPVGAMERNIAKEQEMAKKVREAQEAAKAESTVPTSVSIPLADLLKPRN